LTAALVPGLAANAQQTAPPPPPDQTAPVQDPAAVPLTKDQMKEQRKMQKQDEKAAREKAKADKAQASEMKHEDKSADAAEKAHPNPQ